MRFTLLFCKANPLIWLALLSFMATGCTSKYGPQLTTANYYPQCYQPIAELRKDENSAATATATGAVGGALLGALIGGLVTGKAQGAAIGAVAGGAGGAVAGHAYGKNQQGKRDQQKLASYLQQLDGESANMDRATAAAKVAVRCYDSQFTKAAADLKSGRITKQDFTNRYGEIRSGLEETSRILRNTGSSMAQKDIEYQRVLKEEDPQFVEYQRASASTAGTSTKTVSKSKPKKASVPPRPVATPVAQKTQQWSDSRASLEDTQQDVDARMRGYSDTVDVLLSSPTGV